MNFFVVSNEEIKTLEFNSVTKEGLLNTGVFLNAPPNSNSIIGTIFIACIN